MDSGWSKSRISRLGKALISTSPPPAEPLEELHELLIVYDAALDVAVARIREHVNVQPTSRLKNTGTILEKLRRSGGGSLGNIQDLAGIRIVLDCDLTEQIRFARRVEKIFSDEARLPKIVDRRFEESRGYRAVHVIVTIEGRPVEVQIRTTLQHQWANLFEKFADIVGRGIRYGEPPDEWTLLFDVEFELTARSVLADPGTAKNVRDYATQIQQGEGALDLIIANFMALSNEIRACEMVATFYSSPEAFEDAGQPDELPSLEEMEQRREDVLEAARVLEATFTGMVNLRETYAPIFEAAWGGATEAEDSVAEAAELDREGLRAELRKLVLGVDNGSSSPGDEVVPADGDGSEG